MWPAGGDTQTIPWVKGSYSTNPEIRPGGQLGVGDRQDVGGIFPEQPFLRFIYLIENEERTLGSSACRRRKGLKVALAGPDARDWTPHL